MLVEKSVHHPRDLGPLFIGGTLKAMPRTLDDVKGRVQSGNEQRTIQKLALVQEHGKVLVAVYDQEWRRIRADVGDRVGAGDLVRVVLDRRADQL